MWGFPHPKNKFIGGVPTLQNGVFLGDGAKRRCFRGDSCGKNYIFWEAPNAAKLGFWGGTQRWKMKIMGGHAAKKPLISISRVEFRGRKGSTRCGGGGGRCPVPPRPSDVIPPPRCPRGCSGPRSRFWGRRRFRGALSRRRRVFLLQKGIFGAFFPPFLGFLCQNRGAGRGKEQINGDKNHTGIKKTALEPLNEGPPPINSFPKNRIICIFYRVLEFFLLFNTYLGFEGHFPHGKRGVGDPPPGRPRPNPGELFGNPGAPFPKSGGDFLKIGAPFYKPGAHFLKSGLPFWEPRPLFY